MKSELGERFLPAVEPVFQRRPRALLLGSIRNFMINIYPQSMDTNLVIPSKSGLHRCRLRLYFSDVSDAARAGNLSSIEVSEGIQNEDVAICRSVQRGSCFPRL
jgi:choline monooxygenase